MSKFSDEMCERALKKFGDISKPRKIYYVHKISGGILLFTVLLLSGMLLYKHSNSKIVAQDSSAPAFYVKK